jgi:hypothetical protein
MNQPDTLETLCSRCGTPASAQIVGSLVEIECRECGRFTLPVEEYRQAVYEMAERVIAPKTD